MLSHTVALAEACYLQFSLERVIPGPLWQLGACDHRKLKGSSCSLLSPVLACADWVHRGQVIQTGARSSPSPYTLPDWKPDLGEVWERLGLTSFSGIMTLWVWQIKQVVVNKAIVCYMLTCKFENCKSLTSSNYIFCILWHEWIGQCRDRTTDIADQICIYLYEEFRCKSL